MLVNTSFPHLFVRYSQSYVLKTSFPNLVVRCLQYSPPIESSVIKYYSFRDSSILSLAKSVILIHAISEEFYIDRNSLTFTFIVGSSVDDVISQDISKRYRCCTACSKEDLQALTLPSFPGYTSVMIPMFHWALFHSSTLITTISPTLTPNSCLLCFKLCLSLNDIRYSLLRLFQAASLHF